MTTRKTFTAVCQRSQRWWAIRIPEVQGAFSQARRLDQVERMARDVVSLALEIPPDSFDVCVEIKLPADAHGALERASALRHEAQLAVANANGATVAAAGLLVDQEGLTMREAGRLLGLSHQRIAQLLREANSAAEGKLRRTVRRRATKNRPSRAVVSPEPRVGARVGVSFVGVVRGGEVVEDRGPLAPGGERVVRVRLDFPPEDRLELEIPVSWLQPNPDPPPADSPG
jgi:hypothetical protein